MITESFFTCETYITVTLSHVFIPYIYYIYTEVQIYSDTDRFLYDSAFIQQHSGLEIKQLHVIKVLSLSFNLRSFTKRLHLGITAILNEIPSCSGAKIHLDRVT